MKIITAKFRGSCLACQRDILPGDKIHWEKGTGGQHVVCPDDDHPQRCPTCGQLLLDQKGDVIPCDQN